MGWFPYDKVICPNCNTVFEISEHQKMVHLVRIGNKKLLKCPCCEKTGMCQGVNGKGKKKNTPLYVPVLWAAATILWIITVCNQYTHGEPYGLQLACVLVNGAAAVAYFIRYRRGKNNSNSDER